MKLKNFKVTKAFPMNIFISKVRDLKNHIQNKKLFLTQIIVKSMVLVKFRIYHQVIC